MQIYSLLLLLVSFTFCNGQVKTNLSGDNSDSYRGQSKTITEGQLKIIKTQGTNQYANVHCGMQDKAGNLWFGTTGEGLYRYDGKSFTNFTGKDGLSSNDIWCMYEDKDGNLWFGTGDGVCRYDSSTSVKTASQIFTALRITEPSDSNFQPNNSSNNNPTEKNAVWSILQDKVGNFWFGTDKGVFRYKGKSLATGQAAFTHFLYNDSVINNSRLRLNYIQAILEDRTGNIWFASWQLEGASRFDGKSIIKFTPNDDVMIHSILEDKAGNIWFGTRNHGVSRYDPASGGFTNFSDIKILRSSCVYSMAEDKAGNIWLGTEIGNGGEGTIGGAWCYNPSASLMPGSQAFTNFTTKDGLSHNSVFSVTADKSGKLWFGTRGIGLCSYDGKTFTNFSE